ncbi:hypothetical protein DL96DRAFT_1813104 [Flagelloscypha sp. PMI_526]|nr:hypothetical protein DL96DRAFT_1813104 [Flagelloscypha sp. PMI_526]
MAETLSYDDTTPYDSLPPPPSLAGRIGSTKVYLLEDHQRRSTLGKRKDRAEDDDDDDELGTSAIDAEDIAMEGSDPSQRPTALHLAGTPISHLSTSSIFAYAVHFSEVKPLALEWLDDSSCVLVFTTASQAQSALAALTNTKSGDVDNESTSREDGSVLAYPLPQALWPASERIVSTLQPSDSTLSSSSSPEELKLPLYIRPALTTDVKQRGAKSQSQYYRKHGRPGEPRPLPRDQNDSRDSKRRRTEDVEGLRAALDDELDAFLATPDDEDDQEEALESKMASDAIPEPRPRRPRAELESRITAPLPSRARRREQDLISSKTDLFDDGEGPIGRGLRAWDDADGNEAGPRGVDGDWNAARLNTRKFLARNEDSTGDGSRRRQNRPAGRQNGDGARGRRSAGGGGRGARPKKTQQELDEELDAFLKQD